MKFVKIFLFSLISIFLICCKAPEYIPINNDTIIEYRDTTIYKDSIVYIPVETVKDITNSLDTLHLETSLAEADAWVDTTNNILVGKLMNKKGIKTEYKYKDRIIYKDSIVYQDKPIPVVKEKIITKHPSYEGILWVICLLFILSIYRKLN